MIRAKIELITALAAAVAFTVLLASWQGQRNAQNSDAGASVTDSMLASDPLALTREDAALPIVQDTTVLSGPLPGTIHEPAAPELESAQLKNDRAWIAEAFPALSTWSVSELKPLLATAALNASSDADLAAVMTTLNARLGALQYFDQPQPVEGGETVEYAATTAELQPYTFTAWFEAGAAEVNLVLERQPQSHALYSFDINIPD